MLSCFFFKKKKIAKGLYHTVLTGSCGPTPVLTVHAINKKSSSLELKNRFSWSDLPVQSSSKNHDFYDNYDSFSYHICKGMTFVKKLI